MKYFIGIDIGTTAAKTILFTREGEEVSSFSKEYPLFQEKDGYAEQDPEHWYEAAVAGIREVSKKAPKDSVAGIGISGQMHGLVMLDNYGEVIRRAIIWCDQRSATEADEIETLAGGRKKLIELTSNRAATGFTASKLLWVRKHELEHYKKCSQILLPKDYVRYRLTGEYASDVSDASGTGLFSVMDRKWSKEICAALDIDVKLLPDVYESGEICGRLTERAARDVGLRTGILVAAGAGDQAASAIGMGVVEEGIVSNTLGTSGVIFCASNTPVFDKEGRLHAFCHAVRGKWHLMGVTQGFGLSIKWVKEELAPDLSYSEMDALATKVPRLSNGLLFLPYLIGERCPHYDGNARGVFFGLASTHTKKDMIRSVLEGVCFSQLECLNLIRELGIDTGEVRVGGGAAKSNLIRSILSDMFGRDIATCSCLDTGALGGALLAACAAGEYSDECEAVKHGVKKTKTNTGGDALLYSEGFKLYKKIYYKNIENFKLLSELKESIVL